MHIILWGTRTSDALIKRPLVASVYYMISATGRNRLHHQKHAKTSHVKLFCWSPFQSRPGRAELSSALQIYHSYFGGSHRESHCFQINLWNDDKTLHACWNLTNLKAAERHIYFLFFRGIIWRHCVDLAQLNVHIWNQRWNTWRLFLCYDL